MSLNGCGCVFFYIFSITFIYIYIYIWTLYILVPILLLYFCNDFWTNLFFRRSFWKFNFLAITEEREIYLIIISKQCMESYQFPSTYTAISGLLDDVDNTKQWNFELWHYCTKATIYTLTWCWKNAIQIQNLVSRRLMKLSQFRKYCSIYLLFVHYL